MSKLLDNGWMLRDPALIPLSRQHQHGLALCVLTDRALREDGSAENIRMLSQRVADHYEIELKNHFSMEEELLFPLIVRELGNLPILGELIVDHRTLECMADNLRVNPSSEALENFCNLLRRHIRREENELFEDVQRRLPKDMLEVTGQKIEAQVVRVCL